MRPRSAMARTRYQAREEPWDVLSPACWPALCPTECCGKAKRPRTSGEARGHFQCQAVAGWGSPAAAGAWMASGVRRTLLSAQVYAERAPRQVRVDPR